MKKICLLLFASALQAETHPPADLTKAAVSRHATRSDCWLIIDGAVYDVTAAVADHDQYKYQLDSWCGKDASRAWATKDGKSKAHSRKAQNQLKQMRLGPVTESP